MSSGIHIPVREDWLASRNEAVLDPDLPIIDAHHHLWDRADGRYLYPELLADTSDGHRVVATIYVQCRSMYRRSGPELFRPVGEVEFVNGVAAQAASGLYGDCAACAGIVGFVDLTQGAAAEPALEALVRAGGGRLKGLRIPVAWHEDPNVVSSPAQPPAGLMMTRDFREGVARLERYGLSLDLWAYHTQLDEVFDLAVATPGVAFIIDHCGGPIGVGPYAGRRSEVMTQWEKSLRRLAQLPNVVIKIGGLGMRVAGFSFYEQPMPPSSDVLATAWKPYYDIILDAFSPHRCMFESNFPVDKGMFSYRTFWNACKLLSKNLSKHEREAIFSVTASSIYRLDKES